MLPFRALAEPPVRILLAIGQDVGTPDDEPLRYAERDARRVVGLFTALGDVISHIARTTGDGGAKSSWTNLHETEALAMIVLSDLKERFERHLLYGSDGLLLPDSNDIQEF
jgi:hypothetical protein